MLVSEGDSVRFAFTYGLAMFLMEFMHIVFVIQKL